MERLIRNAEVLYHGELQKKDVLFNEQKIMKIADHIEKECEVMDASGLVLLPGLVDVHVHFREPGHEESETILTGSRAAARGGFTSVFAMPNLDPYPDTVENMVPYLDKIKQDSIVHTYPYATITKHEQGKELIDFKAMQKLGIHWFSDDGVGMNDPQLMERALLQSKQEDMLIACHTEDMHYRRPGACVHPSQYGKMHGWIGIPDECESAPLERDLKIAEKTGGKYHACHISSHCSVEALERAKKKGADVSGEVTAHHLLLECTDVKGPNWKMNPPLRTHADRMALIEGLENGTLDFIANDHAPHPVRNKQKNMAQAAFGIVSLETSFPLLYTEFVHIQKRWTLAQLVNWMSEAPAKRFGLKNTGRIEEDFKSDMILVKLGEETVIDPDHFASKGRNTPFGGWTVNASVKETIVNGSTVWKETL